MITSTLNSTTDPNGRLSSLHLQAGLKTTITATFLRLASDYNERHFSETRTKTDNKEILRQRINPDITGKVVENVFIRTHEVIYMHAYQSTSLQFPLNISQDRTRLLYLTAHRLCVIIENPSLDGAGIR